MTQVSRRMLDKQLEKRMYKLFWEAIAGVSNTADVAQFFEDLLSPTERTMLSKRLAIAFLLVRGWDQRSISNTLHVGLATVSRVNFWLANKGAGYRKVIHHIMTKRKRDDFFLKIDELWTKLTPKIGKGEHLREISRLKRQRAIL